MDAATVEIDQAAGRDGPLPLRLEFVHATRSGRDRLSELQNAWADLQARSVEQNIFYDPAFVLPVLRHLNKDVDLGFLLVWAGFSERLLGLLPVSLSKSPWARVARGWTHNQICVGVPLVDRERPAATLAAMLDWLGHQGFVALIFNLLPEDGALFALLQAQAQRRGTPLRRLASYARAALPASNAAEPQKSGSAKARSKWRRQRRRLGETGELIYQAASGREDVRRAVELFLALEAKGWKGRRKTAFLARPATREFLREVTEAMSASHRCRIDRLEIDGETISMGIILSGGETAYFWKIAYDEAFARYSPGAQLVLEFTQRETPATLVDSCAQPGHSMIERVWADRLPLTDVIVALRPGTRAFGFAVWREASVRWLWRTAKAGFAALRRH